MIKVNTYYQEKFAEFNVKSCTVYHQYAGKIVYFNILKSSKAKKRKGIGILNMKMIYCPASKNVLSKLYD